VTKFSRSTSKVSEKKQKIVLSIQDLRIHFYTYAGVVKAIDGIKLDIYKGETLGLVGETGCGKSVTASAILKLVDSPGKIVGGKVLFEGEDLLEKNEREMRKIRGGKIAIIFQDPTTYLDPVYKIGDQITEVIREHQKPASKQELRKSAVEALKLVQLQDPERLVESYPHELSTGMRQRVMIAMMLCCHPTLSIADEATTALDVTVQAQILRLMEELKKKLNMSMLFITHNLGVVATICDRVAVMYAGKIVELGSKFDVFDNPLHPYTKGLLGAIPRFDQDFEKELAVIPGTLPNLINPPEGCRFYDRCGSKSTECRLTEPELREIEDGHYVSCYNQN
jgi:oligopeptide/dipeptide ABC transporter ATP-binding protein